MEDILQAIDTRMYLLPFVVYESVGYYFVELGTCTDCTGIWILLMYYLMWLYYIEYYC